MRSVYVRVSGALAVAVVHVRATTLPSAATPRVSSLETRSSPRMSTCPRTTVSPGSTRATPGLDVDQKHHAVARGDQIPAGVDLIDLRRGDRGRDLHQQPHALEPHADEAEVRRRSRERTLDAVCVDLGLRDARLHAHLRKRLFDGRHAGVPLARQLDIDDPHAAEKRRQRHQADHHAGQRRRALAQAARHRIPSPAGDDRARHGEPLAQRLNDGRAVRIGVDRHDVIFRRLDGAEPRALLNRALKQALEHQPLHAQADVAVHRASPSPGSSTCRIAPRTISAFSRTSHSESPLPRTQSAPLAVDSVTEVSLKS